MSQQDYFERLEALAEQLAAIAGFASLLHSFTAAMQREGVETEQLEKLTEEFERHSERAVKLLAELKAQSGDGA
jgi:hypothetical protein